MTSSEILQSIIDADSHELRVDFARTATFQLYRACLSMGSVPAGIPVQFSFSPEETTTILVRPFVDKIETLGGLVKFLFSSKAAGALEVLPCRVHDTTGPGIGLMLIVDDMPMISIGSLADEDGLFLRQINPASRNGFKATVFGAQVAQRNATVIPVTSGPLHLRKPK